MDRRASGAVLLFAGIGLIIWYHNLPRTQRESLFNRMSGGQA